MDVADRWKHLSHWIRPGPAARDRRHRAAGPARQEPVAHRLSKAPVAPRLPWSQWASRSRDQRAIVLPRRSSDREMGSGAQDLPNASDAEPAAGETVMSCFGAPEGRPWTGLRSVTVQQAPRRHRSAGLLWRGSFVADQGTACPSRRCELRAGGRRWRRSASAALEQQAADHPLGDVAVAHLP